MAIKPLAGNPKDGEIVVHVRDAIDAEPTEIKNLLLNLSTELGTFIYWRRLDADTGGLIGQNSKAIHIIRHKTQFNQRNAINLMPAYLDGFWYFDPKGDRANSTIATARYSAGEISQPSALQYFDELADRYIPTNRSKFEQMARENDGIANNALVVPLQRFDPPSRGEHHATMLELIHHTIANRGERPVFLKPHPNQRVEELVEIVKFHDPENGIEVIHRSIHDLLDGAHAIVTLSSAVGFEAMLHKTPSILLGDTDFHHQAVPLKSLDRLGSIINSIDPSNFDYPAYLYWFCHLNLLDTQHPTAFLTKAKAVLLAQGLISS